MKLSIVAALISIVGIISLILGSTYKNSDPNKEKKTRRAFYIVGGIALGSGILIATTYLLYFSPKQVGKRIASSMLAEKNPQQFLESCDSLIETSFQDPSIIFQYNQLKDTNPDDVKIFCGNMAKNVLGKV